jgi:hypothetical protein
MAVRMCYLSPVIFTGVLSPSTPLSSLHMSYNGLQQSPTSPASSPATIELDSDWSTSLPAYAGRELPSPPASPQRCNNSPAEGTNNQNTGTVVLFATPAVSHQPAQPSSSTIFAALEIFAPAPPPLHNCFSHPHWTYLRLEVFDSSGELRDIGYSSSELASMTPPPYPALAMGRQMSSRLTVPVYRTHAVPW